MRILVVDDEHDVSTLFLQRFRREIRDGLFEFSFCFSGEDALDYIKTNAQEAILILSDINMPGMTGIELLCKINEEIPQPKPIVMMITAYDDKSTRDQAIQNGAEEVFNKPLDFQVIKDKLLQLK
ncbi:MAG: response regulator [Saprospiraceae bacterium]